MTEKIQTITQDVLLRLEAESDDFWIEVDDGAIVKVERKMTWLHTLIIQNLFLLLHEYVRANELGRVVMDGSRYILGGDSEDVQRAYKPDLSYCRPGKPGPDFDWVGDFEGAPDLAVEVASPGQGNPYFVRRVDRYLDSGVEEVWVIYPPLKELLQYRADGAAPRIYSATDTVTTPLFPELQFTVEALFDKEA